MSRDSDISQLIGDLSADLKPVGRLPPPWLRTAVWLMVVIAVAITMVATRTLLPALGVMGNDPFVLPAAYASLATATLAAVAAFELSLPDRNDAWILLPLPTLLVWLTLNGLGSVATSGIPREQTSLTQFVTCLCLVLVIALPLSVAMMIMLSRNRPLRIVRVGMLGGLAAASASATLLVFIHPHDSPVLDLAALALAVMLVVGVNVILGGRLFIPANKFRPHT
jgi:hypothetical protein